MAAGILLLCLAAATSDFDGADEAAAGSHHGPDGFRNLTGDYEEPTFFDFLRWRFSRDGRKVRGPESYHFPLAENDPGALAVNGDRTTLTWIGHATLLVQIAGRNVLTDPHFSRRASPVQWAGPERVVRPGLALEELPRIDLVVLSHDHYDSLDRNSIRALRARPGGERTTFAVPLGLADWFRKEGVENVVELDWWQSHSVDGLELTAVPVQHRSKRSLIGGRNKTLWAGWVVKADEFSFLFTGDSGYTELFRQIGEKLGPFDLAAIPIGAYEPRWFMKPHHMDPEEAAQVHLDLKSRKSVAIHWGTFILTDEPLDEPPKKLAEALREKGIPAEDFLVLKHGETIVIE